jgi:hypothetical protein
MDSVFIELSRKYSNLIVAFKQFLANKAQRIKRVLNYEIYNNNYRIAKNKYVAVNYFKLQQFH